MKVVEEYSTALYLYVCYEEVMEDNIKLFHEVVLGNGRVVNMDWSPYRIPTQEEVAQWFKLGMPKRVGIAPLNSVELANMGSKT